jgi:hypothetical protein
MQIFLIDHLMDSHKSSMRFYFLTSITGRGFQTTGGFLFFLVLSIFSSPSLLCDRSGNKSLSGAVPCSKHEEDMIETGATDIETYAFFRNTEEL